MKVALVNPRWTFEHSIYFGCRDPHLPLEFGYARALLEGAGHDVLLLDGHLFDRSHAELARDVESFRADMTVVATAPTYLFWRCPPPELRVPKEFLAVLGDRGGITIAAGPHGSATPQAVLHKLGVRGVIRGECEEVILALANSDSLSRDIEGLAFNGSDGAFHPGRVRSASFTAAPALRWDSEWISRHHHHHHRFDPDQRGPGAEVEASRGCPYDCTFCAKIDFRDSYRRRSRDMIVEEIDRLVAQGVTYVYFIDEIFLPDRHLLSALESRPLDFGVQTRIDLWSNEMLDRLGGAGCVSIEAGVESLTRAGRDALAKKCKLETDELAARLVHARKSVPFVQANLIATTDDEPSRIRSWRDALRSEGVWANDPVPLFPYPSSPDYYRLFGKPDDNAWERAHTHYLEHFDAWSDIQDGRPLPLHHLETLRA